MSKEPTPEAKALAESLTKLGLTVLMEVDDGHKHIDIGIPAALMNIEVDGPQHLTDPYQILSDLSRAHFSDRLGFETIHVPNECIHEDLGGIASAIAEAAKIREEQLKNGRRA